MNLTMLKVFVILILNECKKLKKNVFAVSIHLVACLCYYITRLKGI